MSTNVAPPGWHPDPAAPGTQMRWWDGVRWTEHVQPAVPRQAPPPQVVPDWTVGQTQPAWTSQPAWYHAPAAEQTFAQQNKLSLIAAAVVAAYVLIALTTRFVFIGVMPVLLSARAMNRKEPLAPFAVCAAIIAVIVAFATLTGH